jgi:hypothetical protein
MWTYHYEEHLPFPSCDKYGCYADVRVPCWTLHLARVPAVVYPGSCYCCCFLCGEQNYRGVDPPFEPKALWNNCTGIDGCCATPQDPKCPKDPCPCCKNYKACPNTTL